MKAGKFATLVIAVMSLAFSARQAAAARCGSSSAGYEAWKQEFAQEARAHGVGEQGISALMGAHYNQPTINADRGMKSFHLSLDAFMAKRGGAIIAARGAS